MKQLVIFLIFGFFLTSCSIRSVIVDQLEPLVDEMQASILAESEAELVDGSLPFALKLTESLYYYYPDSPYYSGKLALLYAAYAFSYVDQTPFSDFDEEAEIKIARISKLYTKAFNFGLKSLETKYPGFATQIFETHKVDLLLAQIEKADVETLFWLNFSWSLKLFYNLDNIGELVHLSTIKKIADRINEVYPDYLYGANMAVFIAFYGGRVDSLGGDKVKAKEYYEASQKYSAGKSLVADFVYFKFVTILSGDEKEFDLYYNKIMTFDLTGNPAFSFVNQMIQRKAKLLYQKKDLFF